MHNTEHEVAPSLPAVLDDEEFKRVVQQFHEVCHQLEKNAICMIVPSTETRVLTSFGIDPWSPLDQRATTQQSPSHGNHDDDNHDEEEEERLVPTFPILLITDQRTQQHTFYQVDGNTNTTTTTKTNGIRRYFLRPPQIYAEDAIRHFHQQFWSQQQLVPELKSAATVEPKVNSFGVTTLNAVEFQQRFQLSTNRTGHSLVLFTLPSCGHCKRFHNIYNQLSKIIRDVNWDSHIFLYKLDVSQNEVHNMSLPWVPDVFYFPPTTPSSSSLSSSSSSSSWLSGEEGENGNAPPPSTTAKGAAAAAAPVKPIRYDRVDSFRNGVGRVSDPLEILDWLIDVMTGGDTKKWLDPDILLLALLDNDEEEEEPRSGQEASSVPS